jgi:hypothetical protein
MNPRNTLDFLLYDWIQVHSLGERPRFADHSPRPSTPCWTPASASRARSTRPSTGWSIPRSRSFDGEKVILPQATHEALEGLRRLGHAERRAGLRHRRHAAALHRGDGGQQPSSQGLGQHRQRHADQLGNANLLMAHGTALQKQVFALNEFSGRWSGTMCLSEPQAGSSLSDVATRAVPDGEGFEADPLGPRYRLKGNKMWISAGEHELTENIVHLVLAKIPGPGRQDGARHQGHFAVHRAQEAGRRRRAADRRAQRRGAGRPEPQVRLARHHQHAAELWRRQVPGAGARPAPSATWSASPARACAACST